MTTKPKMDRRRGLRRALLPALLAALAPAPSASAAILDFEDHPDGTLLERQYERLGLTFRTAVPTLGDMPGGGANLPSIRDVGAQARSGAQVVNLRQYGCSEFCSARVFGELAHGRAVVEAYAGDYDVAEETAQVTLSAYDGAGRLIGSDSETVTGLRAFTAQLRVEAELRAIRYVIFESAQNRKVGIDDLRFDPDPEPIQNRPPTASFTFDQSEPQAGTPVTFRSTSADSDGSVVRHEWDLDGDQVFEVDAGAEATVSHRFQTAGTHTVRLRVTDDGGSATTADREVLVGSAPPSPPSPPPPPPDADGPEPGTLRIAAIRVDRRGRVAIAAACKPFPQGAVCADELRLRLRRQPLLARPIRVTLPAGSSTTVRGVLTRKARRRLRTPVTVEVLFGEQVLRARVVAR